MPHEVRTCERDRSPTPTGRNHTSRIRRFSGLGLGLTARDAGLTEQAVQQPGIGGPGGEEGKGWSDRRTFERTVRDRPPGLRAGVAGRRLRGDGPRHWRRRVPRRIDWPGRGPTWLGVPALIVAVCGALILLDVLQRQSLSRDLLEDGYFAIADTVWVDVAPGRGSPTV